MTTNPKLTGGPNRGATFRALAALTEDLPPPRRTEFTCTSLTLAFGDFEQATQWASKLDALATAVRQPLGTSVLLSNWATTWRGWNLLITATELAATIDTAPVWPVTQ